MRQDSMSNRIGHNTMPKWMIIFPLFFLIVGALIIAGIIHEKTESDRFMTTAVPVDATCMEVWEETSIDSDGDRTTSYYATVHYEYNGVSYKQDHVSISEWESAGSVITLYLDPNNPADARQPMTAFDFTILLAVIGFFELIALIITILFVKWSRKPKVKLNEPWE